MARLLIVDDEESMRRVLSSIVAQDGHEVVEATGVNDALARLEKSDFDLVLTDQKMPDGTGLMLLTEITRREETLPVIVLTAFATVDLAVDAMRVGAFDFITKPFQPEVIRAAVARACDHGRLLRENIRLKEVVRRLGPAGELVGESAPMKKLREKIARAAPTSATVLIVGETGTGKELAARAVHNLSPRKSQPFVAVNCAALQESLLESELFGHAKGAFTGATSDRKGLFEAAHGGTLFLDEAGEMPLSLQAKLLRVLTDSKVTPVGSTRSREVDVRLVLATHRDLEQRVKDGQFREDLYYRVHVLPLEVPPLRDRPEDVPALVDVFLREVAVEFALPVKTIEPSALDVLKRYPFPGNVRELKNAIERAYILSAGEAISAGDLQLAQREQPASGDVGRLSTIAANLPQRIDLRSLLVELERELLVRALRRADGVQAEAARALGITRSDISYKIRKHGLG